MKQPVLIGRDREIGELRGAWEIARTGNLAFAFISGEAGSGKTSLLDHIATEASQQSMAVFTIDTASSDDTGAPGERLLQMLDGHYGEQLIGALPEQPRAKINDLRRTSTTTQVGTESLAQALGCAAAIQPILLCIDGVNASPDRCYPVLEQLANNHREAPLMVVGTYRDHEVQPSDELMSVIARLDRNASVIHLPLSGLGEPEVREFLETQAARKIQQGIVEDVVAATGGNPLYTLQIARAIQNSLSLNEETSFRALPGLAKLVAQAVAPRFGTLSTRSQEMLMRIALLGNSVSAAELHFAVPDEAVESLEAFFEETVRAGFIVETTAPDRELQARLRHPIIRDAIAGLMSPMQRSQMALEMAKRIESPPGESGSVGTLARLYCQAMTPEALRRCAEYSRRAGHLAIQQQSWNEAIEHYERYVANRAGTASPGAMGHALQELSRALFETNKRSAAKERMVEAFEYFAAGGNVEGVVALVTYPHYHFGYRENLLGLIERARALVPTTHPGWPWVSVRYALALHDDAGAYRRAIEVCSEVLSDPRARTDPPIACRASAIAAVSAAKLRDLSTGEQLVGTCSNYAEMDPTLSVWREYAHEYLSRARGDFASAEDALNRALVRAYRFRERRYRWPALVRATDYAFRRGDFDNAIARAEEGISLRAYKDMHLRDRGTIALLLRDEANLARSVDELRRRSSPTSPWPETARIMLVGLLVVADRYLGKEEWAGEADALLSMESDTLENPYFAMRHAAADGYRAFVTDDRLRGAESLR
ncbi:MAG: AAA family ATPase, partial [Spirochaetes bacterium]|nr:AAA family ATPase [Spirochaetota bacterium]